MSEGDLDLWIWGTVLALYVIWRIVDRSKEVSGRDE